MTDLSLFSVAQCERRLRRNQIAMAAAALAGYLSTYGAFSVLFMRVLPDAWTSWVVALIAAHLLVRAGLWAWREDAFTVRQNSDLLERADRLVARLSMHAAGPRPFTEHLPRERPLDPFVSDEGVFTALRREASFNPGHFLYRDALLETLWSYRVRWAALLVAGPVQMLPAALATVFLFATV